MSLWWASLFSVTDLLLGLLQEGSRAGDVSCGVGCPGAGCALCPGGADGAGRLPHVPHLPVPESAVPVQRSSVPGRPEPPTRHPCSPGSMADLARGSSCPISLVFLRSGLMAGATASSWSHEETEDVLLLTPSATRQGQAAPLTLPGKSKPQGPGRDEA